jgi:hypothetical protein
MTEAQPVNSAIKLQQATNVTVDLVSFICSIFNEGGFAFAPTS